MTGGQLSSTSTTGYTLANALSLDGTMTLGDATNTGALTFSGTATIAGTTALTTASAVTLSGQLTGTGTLTKSGSADLYLTGTTNNNSGSVTVNQGNIWLASDNSGTPNQLASVSSITLTSPGQLIYNGATSPATVTSTISGGGTLVVANTAGVTFSGDLTGYTQALYLYLTNTTEATTKATASSVNAIPKYGVVLRTDFRTTTGATATWEYTGSGNFTSPASPVFNFTMLSGVAGQTYVLSNASASGAALSLNGTYQTTTAFAATMQVNVAGTSGGITLTGNFAQPSGVLAFTKTGTGALTLTGTSALTGVYTVSAGTLNANSATALGATSSTAGISVTSGATLSLGGSADITYASRTLALSGTGVGTTAGALSINNTFTNRFGGISLNADTLIRATDSGTLRAPFTTNNWSVTLGAAIGKTLTLTSDSTIGGLSNVIFGGSSHLGTVVVSAQNTYTGNATISSLGGTTIVGASSVGSVGSITSGPFGRGSLFWGGTIDASVDVNVFNQTSFTGNATFGGTNRLTIYGGASLGASRTLTVNGNFPLYLSGVIIGAGYKITKSGTGTLVLDAANTYSGGTDITQGTLSFGNGGLGTTGSIAMLGGTLRWEAGNTQDISSRLSLTGGVASFDTGANDVSFAVPYTTATASAVEKLGSGSLSLGYPNNWSGAFILREGTVIARGNGALGTSASDLYIYGGKIAASGSYGVAILNDGYGFIGGNVTFGDAVSNQSLTFVADFYLDNGTRTLTTLVPTQFNGAFYGGNITKTGSSSLTLFGSSPIYFGTTTLTTGTLGVALADSLGAASASLALNGGTLTSVFSDPYSLTMVAAGNSTIGGDVTFGDGLTTGTMTLVNNFALGTSAARTLTVATGTTQVFTGVISGSGSSIAKSGPGKLRLSGANTYGGNTNIGTGTLQAGNEQAFGTTGTVTVGAGTTLQTMTTGGQNGKLTVANLTNSAGGTIRIGG